MNSTDVVCIALVTNTLVFVALAGGFLIGFEAPGWWERRKVRRMRMAAK